MRSLPSAALPPRPKTLSSSQRRSFFQSFQRQNRPAPIFLVFISLKDEVTSQRRPASQPPRRYHPASAGHFSRACKDRTAQRRFYLKDGGTALVGVDKVLLHGCVGWGNRRYIFENGVCRCWRFYFKEVVYSLLICLRLFLGAVCGRFSHIVTVESVILRLSV
jgi:hypothetical protein